jgi:YD repeat-containing protein
VVADIWASKAGRLAQVLRVIDDKTTETVEAYEYDKAGNITKKTLSGQVTTLAYNAANELTSTSAGGSTSYSYDKAGRLISSTGGPTNTYGWLDKVVQTSDAKGHAVALSYWPDGQLASEGAAEGASGPAQISKAAFVPGEQIEKEHFLWDGLALLRRDNTLYIAEPHPSGGAVVASHVIGEPSEDTYYLNDLLGTTLAVVKGGEVVFNHLTSFGQMRRSDQPALQTSAIAAPSISAPSVPAPTPTSFTK